MADHMAMRDPRRSVWDRLLDVARPDSRLHFDFAHTHPDFEDSDQAARRLLDDCGLPPPALAFVVPDGAALAVRELLLRRGTALITSTYCMRRGFRLLDPAAIAPADHAFAATLDGVERFGRPIGLDAMAALGRIDLVVTGAAAVSANGARFGRSYQYFDIEWGLLAELGMVDNRTPVAVVIHEVQLTDERVHPLPTEAVPDVIVTNARVLRIDDRPRRPTGVHWQGLDPEDIEDTPALRDLQRLRGLRR